MGQVRERRWQKEIFGSALGFPRRLQRQSWKRWIIYYRSARLGRRNPSTVRSCTALPRRHKLFLPRTFVETAEGDQATWQNTGTGGIARIDYIGTPQR